MESKPLLYVGVDNGVTGAFAGVTQEEQIVFYMLTPVKKSRNYQKTEKYITRIDWEVLAEKLAVYTATYDVVVVIERPMVNPGRLTSSLSAVRSLEATLVVLEGLNIPYHFIDSKMWQSEFFPGAVSREVLKGLSKIQGCIRLEQSLPSFKNSSKYGDFDALFIALYTARHTEILKKEVKNGKKKVKKSS